MKVYHFMVGFLGGPVDLKTFFLKIKEKYGEVTDSSEEVKPAVKIDVPGETLEWHFYVYPHGFFSVSAVHETEDIDFHLNNPISFWKFEETGKITIEFLKNALDIKDFSDLKKISVNTNLSERPTGVYLLPAYSSLAIGYVDVDSNLFVGELPKSLKPGAQVCETPSPIFLLEKKHFYSPEISPEALGWLMLWSLREYAPNRLLQSFQVIHRDTFDYLKRLREHLKERNRYYWEWERERMAGFSADLKAFSGYYNYYFLPYIQSFPSAEKWPFSDEIQRMKTPREKDILRIEKLLKGATEMTDEAHRILTLKENKALEKQMEKVNFRMILLALLALGITALGTLLSPNFSVSQKISIIVALAFIPILILGG